MTAPRKSGKTGSRNPANKPTDASTWKKTTQAPLLTLPSGNVMRVQKIGLQALMKTGKMPNSLMAYADRAVKKGKKQEVTDEDMVKVLQDEDQLREISNFMDTVTIICAQEPKVYPVPEEGVERDDDLLYVDDIDEDDKSFLFQAVMGGTTDVETFRAERAGNVAAVRRRQNMGGKAKQSPRDRG
jgi:hypothetical protein